MKEYEMELRIVVKVRAHDIDAAQNKATDMRVKMRAAFPEIEKMEFATDFSLRPCDQPNAIYPDPHSPQLRY